MFIFALVETGGKEGAPIVTIPAGRSGDVATGEFRSSKRGDNRCKARVRLF